MLLPLTAPECVIFGCTLCGDNDRGANVAFVIIVIIVVETTEHDFEYERMLAAIAEYHCRVAIFHNQMLKYNRVIVVLLLLFVRIGVRVRVWVRVVSSL